MNFMVGKLYLNEADKNKNKKPVKHSLQDTKLGGFPGGTVVENPPANAGDTGSISGPGRSHMPWSN